MIKFVVVLLLLSTTQSSFSLSFQSHEELIDLAWIGSIRPLLLKRFPSLTEAQLREAHAYAYGGCSIQDFGYYPFGNEFFSDLTHYVRAGDFVVTLLQDAKTANELAFAIGALAHYIGDATGHGEATNPAVAISFPKLEKKYGPSVNYAQNPHAHVQTEFAFDINQLSKHRFAPPGYLEMIGLKVPHALLRNAFYETYGIRLDELIGDKERMIGVHGFAVRKLLPDVSRAETLLHKNFPDDLPSQDLDKLRADLRHAEDELGWHKYDRKPGFKSHVLAGFIFILPKFGPLALLKIRVPTQQTEELYIKSMYESVATLRHILNDLNSVTDYVPDRDLDTGKKVQPGGYKLTDETYDKLLEKLVKHPAAPVPALLKQDIMAYYADPLAPITTKKDEKHWARVQANLKVLQAMPTIANTRTQHASSDSGQGGDIYRRKE